MNMNSSIKIEKIDIVSYKHDGELHRVWKNVDKIYESKDLVVIINNEVDVIDGDGRKWKTREPAVCYFFKKYWFNVICMLRNGDIYYYCNLSSPYVIDSEGIKYIDYDLDIKVFPGGEMLELDRDEYTFNVQYLHYSENIRLIIQRNLDILIDLIKNRKDPFNRECVYHWYELFLENKN